MPIILETLLHRFGLERTLRIWGLVTLAILTPSLFFLRGRTPIDRHLPHPPINFSFLGSRLFHIYGFSNVLQALGYFIPAIYLPTFASDVSIPHVHGVLLLSLLNISSTVGRILMGYVSDITDIHLPLFLSSFLGALCAFFLWGMGNTIGMLIAFALIYGIVAGGYTTLYPRFSQAVAPDDEQIELTVYGVLLFQRGLGNIVAGPVSSALVESNRSLGGYGFGKYEGVVLFVGVTLMCSSFGVLGKLYKPRFEKWREGEEG
jgi:MFS family permease